MFKKVFLISLLALGLHAESIFAGVSAGVPITTPKYNGALSAMKDSFPKTGIGYNLGVNAGYEDDLGPNDGFKLYLEYNYSQSYGKRTSLLRNMKATISSQMITLNADYYYDFTDLFGAYLGIGAGYVSYKPKYTLASMTFGNEQKGGFALPINLGLLLHTDDDHDFSIGVKIPLVGYKYKIENSTMPNMSGSVKLSNYIVSIGYNYTF